jgi:DNA-binding Lrp family transcriptional regulator
MYDKFALVLRLETTSNDVSAFKHHRKVEHRRGPASRALAPVKKSIYSLNDLRDILLACNRRYLAFLSALDDFSGGLKALDRLTRPQRVADKTIKGFNFFDPLDHAFLHALQRPAFNIAGLRRADLAPALASLSPATITRRLCRLRQLGIIKRVTRTYRYYLTRIGRAAIAAAPASLNSPSFQPSHDLISAHKSSRVGWSETKGIIPLSRRRMTAHDNTCGIPRVLYTSGFGASRPLRRIPAIVSFLNPQPAFSLAGGNRSSCP